jgi:hypothetical protein
MTQNVSCSSQTGFRIELQEESIRAPNDRAISECGGGRIAVCNVVHRNAWVSVSVLVSVGGTR